MEKKKEKLVNEIEILFSKEQILKSNRFKDKRDILSALLEDDKKYKLSDVESMIVDFLSANRAYLKLSNTIGGAEMHIRDNMQSQDKFNKKLNDGFNLANQLTGSIKSMVGAYLGVQSIKKLLEQLRSIQIYIIFRQMQKIN